MPATPPRTTWRRAARAQGSIDPPRSTFGAVHGQPEAGRRGRRKAARRCCLVSGPAPQGGNASGPAEPVPRRLLGSWAASETKWLASQVDTVYIDSMRHISIRPVPPLPPEATQALKGRGTAWALAHRFSTDERESIDDGWGNLDQAVLEQPLAPGTQVLEEQVKSILARNDSPDIGFDLSVNPYRGCEHVIPRNPLCV